MTKDETLALAGAMAIKLDTDGVNFWYGNTANFNVFDISSSKTQMLAIEKLKINLTHHAKGGSDDIQWMAEIRGECSELADMPSSAVERLLREYARMLVERMNDE